MTKKQCLFAVDKTSNFFTEVTSFSLKKLFWYYNNGIFFQRVLYPVSNDIIYKEEHGNTSVTYHCDTLKQCS